jgi:hypothetical protein
MKPFARTVLLLSAVLGMPVALWADYWVVLPDAAVRHGLNRRQGPFATREKAEDYVRSSGLSGCTIEGSDSAPASSTPEPSPQDTPREQSNEAEARSADERLHSERARREAEETRRFAQTRDDALKQLKGVGSGRTSDLKMAPKPASPPPALPDVGPNVVDARNVPSGLPPAIERALADAFAGAVPAVTDRVRRGFQAVILRDWKLAEAWFGDALNHDPSNLELKKLIELCRYSPEKNRPAPVPVIPPSSPPRAATPSQTEEDAQTKAELDAIFDKLLREAVLNEPRRPRPPAVQAKPYWKVFFDYLRARETRPKNAIAGVRG